MYDLFGLGLFYHSRSRWHNGVQIRAVISGSSFILVFIAESKRYTEHSNTAVLFLLLCFSSAQAFWEARDEDVCMYVCIGLSLISISAMKEGYM